jgi:signal peptidase I
MTRVHEVATELGVSAQEVMAALDRIGRPVTSHTSSVAPTDIEAVKAELWNGAKPGAAESIALAASSAPAPAREKIEEKPTVEETTGNDRPTTARPPGGDGPSTGESPKKPKRRFGIFPRHRPNRSLGARIVGQVAELPILILIAFLIAVVIKTFLVQAFYIPSESMKPTLKVGDRVLVEKVSYLLGGPGQGDVVVFARNVFGKNRPDVPWYRDVQNYVRELLGLPTGSEEDYIKRVVGVGGDVISYQGSPRQLVVNGEEIEEPYLKGEDRSSSTIGPSNCKRYDLTIEEDGCRVPAGRVFVMGDNRSNSADSRSIGPVEEDKVVGRAFVVIWPISSFGGL